MAYIFFDSGRVSLPFSMDGKSSSKSGTSSSTHGHATTWKELVEFLLSFVTSAVLDHSVNELIYPRCFRQLGYLVAQPLGVLF